MISFKNQFTIALGILFSKLILAQPVTFLAPPLQDTYIQPSGVQNHPTDPIIQFTENGTPQKRGLIQFDLSSIPYGSVVTSATLQYRFTSIPAGPAAWRKYNLQYIPFNWNGATINWSAQPWSNDGAISDMPQPINLTASTTSAATTVTVTTDVNYMVCRKKSFGWMFVKDNPPGTLTIASNDNSTVVFRPTLSVTYCPPFDASVLTTPASNNTSTDGAIDLSVTGGSGNFSYQWFTSGGSFISATQDIASLSSGYYKLQVTDITTVKVYNYFVAVGDYQGAVTINLQPDETYGLDAYVRNTAALFGGPPAPEPFRNYENDNILRTGMNNTDTYESYLKFNYLGLEEANNVIIENATLDLKGKNHFNQGLGTNFKIKRVTSLWYEDCVTYLNQPTADASTAININPGPTNSLPDVTADLTPFAIYHNQNPALNYGYFLNWYSTPPSGGGPVGSKNYDEFHSSSASAAAKRPALQIKFRLKKDYAELVRKLDGQAYNMKAFLKFRYKEDYNDQDGKLTYNIYRAYDNKIVASQTDLSLNVQYGDNRYIMNLNTIVTGGLAPDFYVLEVINEKNEKQYLRFKLN